MKIYKDIEVITKKKNLEDILCDICNLTTKKNVDEKTFTYVGLYIDTIIDDIVSVKMDICEKCLKNKILTLKSISIPAIKG